MLSVCLHWWNISNAKTFLCNRLEDWQVMVFGVANVGFCSFPFPEELIDCLMVLCADA